MLSTTRVLVLGQKVRRQNVVGIMYCHRRFLIAFVTGLILWGPALCTIHPKYQNISDFRVGILNLENAHADIKNLYALH